MSQEDVSMVLAFHAAYNAREIDAVVDSCAVDVNVFPDATLFPESSALVGREKFRDFLEETSSAWSTSRVTPKEVLDIGDGRVLVRADWGGTGSASGVETHMNLSQIYTIRGGQVARAEYFFDHQKALEALGLEG
jgi:ketosteroid isomerase-like protein